jgi:GNAT superfamily N-acetyltransferase
MPGKRDARTATSDVTIRSVDAIAPEDRDAIVDGLLGYNADNGARWAGRELSVVAREESGSIVGGLLGETNLDWLFVAALWVAEGHRRHGTGSALLAEAEEEARRRGCVGVYLDTYSFQARPFYERLGYQLFGTLPDCPPGATKYYLYKRLDEAPDRLRTAPPPRR